MLRIRTIWQQRYFTIWLLHITFYRRIIIHVCNHDFSIFRTAKSCKELNN